MGGEGGGGGASREPRALRLAPPPRKPAAMHGGTSSLTAAVCAGHRKQPHRRGSWMRPWPAGRAVCRRERRVLQQYWASREHFGGELKRWPRGSRSIPTGWARIRADAACHRHRLARGPELAGPTRRAALAQAVLSLASADAGRLSAHKTLVCDWLRTTRKARAPGKHRARGYGRLPAMRLGRACGVCRAASGAAPRRAAAMGAAQKAGGAPCVKAPPIGAQCKDAEAAAESVVKRSSRVAGVFWFVLSGRHDVLVAFA